MYGFSHFALQLNYLPKQLVKFLPHTDSRMRPDQRYLEEGDMIMASKEKDRLEQRQRKMRKLLEEKDLKYKPKYFNNG